MRLFQSAALPVALTVVLSAGVVSSATAATRFAASASRLPVLAAPLLPAGQAWQVTLITGDVVGVRTVAGRPPMVTITPGPGRQHVIFSRYEDSRGHVLVIPQDVAPLIGRVLDPSLFDVTTLIRSGDDDAHRAALPLIVQAGAAAMPPMLRTGRILPRLHAIAASEPRRLATRVGDWLARMAAAASVERPAPQATGNIRHIWLGGSAPAAGRSYQNCSLTSQRTTTYPLTVRATPLPGTAPGKMSGLILVLGLNSLAFCQYPEIPIGQTGTGSVRLPAGNYWLVGAIDDNTTPATPRSDLVSVPQITVHGPVTVRFDGAKAVPVTASVAGHPTEMAEDGIWIERTNAGNLAGWGTSNLTNFPSVLFAEPTGTARTGTFRAYTFFNLTGLHAGRHPYSYDLWRPVGDRIPASLTYRVSRAQQARLAQVHSRFYALDGNHVQVWDTRYGLDPAGVLAAEMDNKEPGGSTRTDYITPGPGISWNQEAVPPLRVNGQDQQGAWVIEVPLFAHLAPGSSQTADWIRQPFAPGPYSATVPAESVCAPHASIRTGNEIEADLTDLTDLPDGFDCLGLIGVLSGVTSRTMRLYSGRTLLGTSHFPGGIFAVPARSSSFRLSYSDNFAKVLTVSTRTDTSWTFRAPAGGRLPLLLVRYQLPLNLDNHPDGSTAVLTVGRIAGVHPAQVTSVRFWTSTDQGKTWQPATVRKLSAGRYAAALPHAAPGQSVSLRVTAADAGGSGISQTIITAYHG